jgi:IS5 family transposase
MKRRAAVESVIGHIKAEHRMDRNYLKGRHGDRANALLAAAVQLHIAAALTGTAFARLIRALFPSPLHSQYRRKLPLNGSSRTTNWFLFSPLHDIY